MYRYQKGDYESMRAETLKFAKERYFNGYSDTRPVQENFNLITSFIQESADKHSVPFHLFGNGGGALAIGKNYARNAQIGKKLRRKIL